MQLRDYKYVAGEKLWLRNLHELGSVRDGRAECVHHAIGRTAQVNVNFIRLPIGAFWCLPLTHAQHAEIHAAPDRKQQEKRLFMRTVGLYRAQFGDLPFMFSEEIIEAVRNYTR